MFCRVLNQHLGVTFFAGFYLIFLLFSSKRGEMLKKHIWDSEKGAQYSIAGQNMQQVSVFFIFPSFLAALWFQLFLSLSPFDCFQILIFFLFIFLCLFFFSCSPPTNDWSTHNLFNLKIIFLISRISDTLKKARLPEGGHDIEWQLAPPHNVS